MVQCLFKTLPAEPGIHEKKLFEDVFGCEVTNWMWKHSDVLLPFVHHWNILWNSSSSSKIYFWSSSSSSKYHSSRYGFELISFTVQFDEQESSTFEVSWNIFLASSSSCFPCLKSTSNNRVLVTLQYFGVKCRNPNCKRKIFKNQWAYNCHRTHRNNAGTLCAEDGMMFQRFVEFPLKLSSKRRDSTYETRSMKVLILVQTL